MEKVLHRRIGGKLDLRYFDVLVDEGVKLKLKIILNITVIAPVPLFFWKGVFC